MPWSESSRLMAIDNLNWFQALPGNSISANEAAHENKDTDNLSR
jgi:hypothetical protein